MYNTLLASFSHSETMVKDMSKLCLFVFIILMFGRNGAFGQVGDEAAAATKEMVPAMFIFGDSLIDNGNNNNLASLAKANYYPYGIDFRGGATGRFCNGYTMVDEIAELLGLPLIPAYSQASTEDQMLHGINYASAAAGILDITGRNFVGRIPFNQQLKNFEDTLDKITDNLGAPDVAESLAKCVFFVGMGSNDYLNNYLMPNYPTRNQFNGQQSERMRCAHMFSLLSNKLYIPGYSSLLNVVLHMCLILQRLYNLGARKVIISGLGLLGCIPSILSQSSSGHCSEEVNQLVLPFNTNLKTMVNNLSTNLPGSHFIYLDIHNMFQDILRNSRLYGFSVIDRGCCGIGRNRGQITCLPLQQPCRNRNQYVFWDAFHPTAAVNIIMGRKAFTGNQDVAYPINIQQLANL
ncbi:GDSL esterase/lipase [Heracleum sosnowskyi]|uniref:GDSL esterase/lipase n=1 Tax=Heracleum sosnowskyi TaxID=360622 RepID=A0AAD8JJC3_9APIA|nr:GDSL esterase/lipase [Heracleum sosnowskyi]